jgi:hypothetical protein
MGGGRAAETKRESRLTCNYSTLQLQPPSTLCYSISLIGEIATDCFMVCGWTGGEEAMAAALRLGGDVSLTKLPVLTPSSPAKQQDG